MRIEGQSTIIIRKHPNAAQTPKGMFRRYEIRTGRSLNGTGGPENEADTLVTRNLGNIFEIRLKALPTDVCGLLCTSNLFDYNHTTSDSCIKNWGKVLHYFG